MPPTQLPLSLQVVISMLLVVPLGPMIYRLAYQPVASASVLVLLIVSVAVHLALIGLGLLFFGAEGSRTPGLGQSATRSGGADGGRHHRCHGRAQPAGRDARAGVAGRGGAPMTPLQLSIAGVVLLLGVGLYGLLISRHLIKVVIALQIMVKAATE